MVDSRDLDVPRGVPIDSTPPGTAPRGPGGDSGQWPPGPLSRVLEHARLAHELALRVHDLRQAIRTGGDSSGPIQRLQDLISIDLESSIRASGLHASVGRLSPVVPAQQRRVQPAPGPERGGSVGSPPAPEPAQRSGGSPVPSPGQPPGMGERLSRRHAQEHRRLLAAFATFEQMTMSGTVVPADRAACEGLPEIHSGHLVYPPSAASPTEALRQADYIQRLWNAHIAHEDLDAVVASSAGGEDSAVAAGRPALSREDLAALVRAAVAHEHRQLAGLVATARASRGEASQYEPFSRATAALSAHACLVAVQLSPIVLSVLPDRRGRINALRAELFEAARSMLRVESALRGDVSEARRGVPDRLARVDALLAQHCAGEEELIGEFVQVAGVVELCRLLGKLRPGLDGRHTRPHQVAMSPRRAARAGARVYRFVDRLRDEVNNRITTP